MTLAEVFIIKDLFDSHAHLAYSTDAEVEKSVSIAKQANLAAIFNMGINLESSRKVVEQAKSSENYARAFVGIDPEVFQPGSDLFVGLESGEAFIEEQTATLLKLIQENLEPEQLDKKFASTNLELKTENLKLISGIGETGMDYYHLEQNNADESTKDKSKKLQRELFIKHLEIAQLYRLPLSIHSRWAEKDCLEIAKRYDCIGIFHSFTGGYETAKKILDAGWGLGVNGIVTFKNADQLRGIYSKILGKISADSAPLDFYKKGIFFETDAPFLAPEGKRGEKNEPAYVRITFESFVNFLKK